MANTNVKGKLIPNEKLARICWNDNGWTKPSGENGKSKDDKTFECQYHFGFEEWLFDNNINRGKIEVDSLECNDKSATNNSCKGKENILMPIFDGFQYGFLQELNSRSSLSTFVKKKKEDKEDASLTLHLFTLSPINQNGGRMKLYIGYIKNIQVLGTEEQEKVYHHFLSTGRLPQMYNDVYDVEGIWPRRGILNTRPEDVFNIKFNMDNVKLFYPWAKELDPLYFKYTRYKLCDLYLSMFDSVTGGLKTTGYEFNIETGKIIYKP